MLRNIVYRLISTLVLVNAFASAAAAPTAQIKNDEIFIPTSCAELFCHIMGSGDPIIVIHGGAGFITHDYLLSPLAPLAKNRQVIFYDQRGLGKSTGESYPEHINLKTYVEDIEVIRTSLGLKKVSLLGHSWGGLLAMHYALLYPNSIDKLILVSSMPGSSEDLGLFFSELPKRLAPYQEQLDKIESSELYLSGDPQTVENQLKMVFKTYMYSPENINQLNLRKSQKAAIKGFKIWEIFKEQVFMKPYDLTKALRKISCPTLILHGDVDPIPFVAAENLKAAIPSSKLIRMDQCGHFPFVEQPESFLKEVTGFLD